METKVAMNTKEDKCSQKGGQKRAKYNFFKKTAYAGEKC